MIRYLASFILILLLPYFVKSQINYVSPLPNSSNHNPETSIIIGFETSINVNEQIKEKILLTDSKNQSLSFKVGYSSDLTRIIVKPSIHFNYGDTIRISLESILLSNQIKSKHKTFQFFIKKHNPVLLNNTPVKKINEKKLNYFPPITINVNENLSEGKIFFHNLSALASENDRFYGIIENDGTPFYAQQDNNKGLNFTLQDNGYLTYWNNKNFHMLDSAYQVIDSFACKNGYEADWHEFQITESGHAFLLAWDIQIVDMSEVVTGGQKYATVEGVIIQELDENKNLVFQWRSWDHFNITDAEDVDFTTSYISYVHGNALDIDADGNILLSSRLMNEITKIDRSTGEIIWRLGGKNNEFTFINDEGFCRQHDIRRIYNGNLTLFDNGGCHSPQISSAKEYQLDEINKTATLVWSYQHPKEIFCETMGSVQRLENGNTFINWGEIPSFAMTGDNLWPAITEVTSDKKITYELTFDTYFHLVYRSHRFKWDVDSPTGSTDIINKNNHITLFPNPATKIFYITNVPLNYKMINIKLYDLNGRVIINSDYVNNNEIKIDISNFKAGIYICNIFTGDIIFSKKVIIE